MKKQTVVLSLIVAAAIGSAALLASFHTRKQRSAARMDNHRSAVAPILVQNFPGTAPQNGQRPSNIPAPASKGTQGAPPRVIPLRFEEFDQRILLAPKEIITLQIDAGVPDNGLIKIEAPNGGSINGHKAPAMLPAADAANGIQFAVGPTRGLYTLEVSRGRATRIFEFWVGGESPVGQPGPERIFVH